MPRKSKSRKPSPESGQLAFDFGAVIGNAKVLSREEVMHRRQPDESVEYSPIDRTAEYMRRAVKMEEAWETTVQKARERLLTVDPRDLYFEFLCDLKSRTEKGGTEAERYAKQGNFYQANAVLMNCKANISDKNVQDLLGAVSVNYSDAHTYACSGGINATIGSTLGGHRYSYSSCVISPDLSYSSSAMDAMEKNFSKDEDVKTTVTVTQSEQNNIQSSTYIDASKLKIDPNIVYVPSFSIVPPSEEEEKATAAKKRSGKDW